MDRLLRDITDQLYKFNNFLKKKVISKTDIQEEENNYQEYITSVGFINELEAAKALLTSRSDYQRKVAEQKATLAHQKELESQKALAGQPELEKQEQEEAELVAQKQVAETDHTAAEQQLDTKVQEASDVTIGTEYLLAARAAYVVGACAAILVIKRLKHITATVHRVAKTFVKRLIKMFDSILGENPALITNKGSGN